MEPTARTLIAGEGLTLSATLRGPAGETLSGRDVSWSSTSPDVVSLGSTVGSRIVVNALAPGRSTIRASAEGRSATAQIDVIEGPSLVLATPLASFAGFQGETAPGVTVGVANGGNGEIVGLATQVTYPSGEPSGWLSVGLDGTTVPTTMTLTGSAASLAPGVYSATVRVTSPSGGGLSADLAVEFTVQVPPPSIVLSTPAVGLNASVGSPAPARATVGITNGGSGSLTGLGATVTYAPGGPTGWLSIALSADTAPATLSLAASAQGLAAGVYTARVAVTSPVARMSPVFLDVTFQVAPGGSPPGGGPAGSP